MTRWAAIITASIASPQKPITVGNLHAYKRGGYWFYRGATLPPEDPYNFWRCAYLPFQDEQFNKAAHEQTEAIEVWGG